MIVVAHYVLGDALGDPEGDALGRLVGEALGEALGARVGLVPECDDNHMHAAVAASNIHVSSRELSLMLTKPPKRITLLPLPTDAMA